MKIEAFITHNEDWDTLLVRVGHHLWKWYKQAKRYHDVSETNILEDALESVWAVKRAYRAPIKAASKARYQASGKRLVEHKRRK